MKALRKLQSGPGHVELVEVDRPVPGRGEVLVEVQRAGICGTDIHILHGRFAKARPPVTLSHEFCGAIAELGAGVTAWQIGDRITSETSAHFCGTCRFCREGQTQLCAERLGFGYATDGAFARYIRVRADLLHRLPDTVSFTEGALSEPLAVATHIVMERSACGKEHLALITGPGAIGLAVLLVVKAVGARAIITGVERDRDRLALAKKLGADRVVHVDRDLLSPIVSEMTDGFGVDVAFECTGSAAGIRDCIGNLRKAGELVTVGLQGKPVEIDYDSLIFKEINLRGSFAHNKQSWNKAMDLLDQGRVNLRPLVTAEYPLDQWQEAFRCAEAGEGVKYLLYPAGD